MELLIKDASETVKNEAKEQKGGFLSMILGTLGATLLRNLLIGRVTIIAGEETIRSGENFYAVPSFIQFWNTKELLKKR